MARDMAMRRACVRPGSCSSEPSRSGCGSCGRMTRARTAGWSTSRSWRTETVTTSMKVMPATQWRRSAPTKFSVAKRTRSGKAGPSTGCVAASSQRPRRRGRKSILRERRRPTLTTAAVPSSTRTTRPHSRGRGSARPARWHTAHTTARHVKTMADIMR